MHIPTKDCLDFATLFKNDSIVIVGMPGIQSFLGQSLDPFSIFGLTRQNWYEGPNVCIERKVINEEGEETVEDDDAEVVAGSMRHGKFMKYVT